MATEQLSPAADKARRFSDLSDAMNLVRLPASQVSFLLHGCLDTLPEDLAEMIRMKMADRDFSVKLHRVAKEVIVLTTLREMLSDPDEVSDYFSYLNGGGQDPVVVAARQGMMSMMLH